MATLHFGTLIELYHWLRARGFAVAALAARETDRMTDYRAGLYLLSDQANHLDGVPQRFRVDQLWDARDYLRHPRRLLMISLDNYCKRSVIVRGPDYRLRLDPGALQLAAVVDALVIPCLISVPRGLTSTIYFGRPVPDQWVVDRRQHSAGCEHIVRELIPWIASLPEQCAPQILFAFLPPSDA